MTEATVAIPLHSRRRARAQRLQHVQHAISAAGLAVAGTQAIQAGAHGFELGLAIAAVVTSAVLIVAVARHLREPVIAPHSHGHRIGWVDLFASAMLFTEALERWRVTGRLWTPTTLTALATLTTGLLHARVTARRQRRRTLALSEDEITLTRGPFRRRFSARWDDIAEIDINHREALIHTHQGAHQLLNLADLANAADVIAALRDARQRLRADATNATA
jgi:hypothetical protein